MAEGGIGTAIRRGALVGVAIVVLAAALIAAYAVTGHRLPGQGRQYSGQVLVVAALPNAEGDIVASVIAAVDTSGGSAAIRSIEPSSPITMVGSGYDLLRDAYAIGGGGAVAEGVAQQEGADPMPFVDLGPDAVSAAITAAGGVSMDLPSEMNVFDGVRLYTLPAGPITASADEFRAIIDGAAFLPAAERESVLQQASSGIVGLLAGYPGGLPAAVEAGVVMTDLGDEGLSAVVTALTATR